MTQFKTFDEVESETLKTLVGEQASLAQAADVVARMRAMIAGFDAARKSMLQASSFSYEAEWARTMQWLAVAELITDLDRLRAINSE